MVGHYQEHAGTNEKLKSISSNGQMSPRETSLWSNGAALIWLLTKKFLLKKLLKKRLEWVKEWNEGDGKETQRKDENERKKLDQFLLSKK